MSDNLKCNYKMHVILNSLLEQIKYYIEAGNTHNNIIRYQYATLSHLQIYSEIATQWFNEHEFLKEYFKLETIYDLKISMKEEYFNEETLDNIITVMKIKGML